LIDDGEIRAYEVGRVIRLRKNEVDAFRDAHVIEGPTRLSGDPLSEGAPARLAKRRPGEVTPVLTSPKAARKGVEVAIRQLPSSPPCRLSPLQREEPH